VFSNFSVGAPPTGIYTINFFLLKMLKLERLVDSGDELCDVGSSVAFVVFTF
jgi:hypothetical protein